MLDFWAWLMLGTSALALLARLTSGQLWRWLRFAPPASLAALALHILTGSDPFTPRLIPAYLLVGLTFADALPALLHPASRIVKPGLTRSIILLALFVVSVLAIVVFPFCPLPGPTGSCSVRSDVFLVTRPVANHAMPFQQGEPLPIQVWYPADAGTKALPLVLIAPGNLATRRTSESLAREIASRGMRVVSVDYPGQSIYARLPEGGVSLPQRRYLEEGIALSSRQLSPADAASLAAPWAALRAEDLRLVLACLLAHEGPGCPAALWSAQPISVGIIAFGISAGPALELCISNRCSALALVDSVLQPFQTDTVLRALPEDTAVLFLNSEQHRRYLTASDFLVERLAGSAQQSWFTAVVPRSGTCGLTDQVLQSPMLARLMDGVPVDRQALLSANRCLAAFVTNHLNQPAADDPWQLACFAEDGVLSEP